MCFVTSSTEAERYSQLSIVKGILTLLKMINNDVETAATLSLMVAPHQGVLPKSVVSIWDSNPEVKDDDIDPDDPYFLFLILLPFVCPRV